MVVVPGVKVALLLGVALCVVVVVDVVLAAATQAQTKNVTVLDLLYRKDQLLSDRTKAYRAGLKAALWSRNYTVAGGRKLQLVTAGDDVTAESVQSAIATAVQRNKDIIAVLGPAGDEVLEKALPALKEHNLVALGPYTGSTAVRRWEPQFYFLRTDPMAAVYAHVWYAIAHLRVLRLGVMYLTGISYGDKEHMVIDGLMKGMGYELCGMFRVPGTSEWNANDAEFRAEWEAFVSTRPQAVIIMGKPSKTTEAFIKQVLNDVRTRGVYLQAMPDIQETLVASWWAAIGAGTPFAPGLIVTTGANPLPRDTRYNAIRRFRTVMAKYLREDVKKEYNDSRYLLSDDIAGEAMMDGWIVGEVLSQIFASSKWVESREKFARSLFNQRRYTVDDLVIGDFGGECNRRASSQGAICKCNQGGRTVFIKTFGRDGRARVMKEGEFTYPLRKCYPILHKMPTPINAVTFFINKNGRGSYASRVMVYGGLRAVPPPFERDREYTLKVLTGPIKHLGSLLMAEARVRRMDIFIGMVVKDVLQVPNLTFVDPLFVFVLPRVVQRNVLYLSPTLDQELYVLADYLSASSVDTVSAVILSAVPHDIAALLRRTLVAHGIALGSVVFHAPREKIVPDIPREGWVFVLGFSMREIESLLEHVRANPGLRVMISSAEHHFYFPQLSNRSVSDATDRILFATNLPHWAERDSSLEFVRKYHKAVPDASRWSPMGLTGFAASRAVMTVADMMDTITPELFADTVYSRVMIKVDEVEYGPFRLSKGGECRGAADPQCLVNYGATSIAVWSLSRTINSSIPPVAAPVTPSMDYSDPNAGRLTGARLIGVIAGGVLGVALFAAVVAVLLFCCRDSRDNRNAPKERTAPVTLVFTDIESSTALWAACPKEMPDTVATHHRLVRLLIAKYGCYEVKTIGDSFMIASRSAFAAVQLVRELQQVFVQHNWGTTALDDAYRTFEERRAAEEGEEEYVPPTARLDADVYRRHWNGLRVRVGVHTGLCDIRCDPVTKGYDYYGSTSNTAARTESVANGGQVLLTRAAYMALSTAEREQVNVTALGPVALRGVPRPVMMYQLDAVPGRTFAALRLEREANDLEECTESSRQSASSTSNQDPSVAHDNPFLHMMTDLLGPLSPPQRQKVLQMLCERWGVPVSFKKWGDTTDACAHAVCRLALKLTQVTTRKAEMSEGEPGEDMTLSLASQATCMRRSSCSGYSFDMAAFVELRNRVLARPDVGERSVSCSTPIVCNYPPGFSAS